VNKFLGDGIMFFMGAPVENPNHASDAVQAVHAMQQDLESFSRELQSRGLPAVKMRAGISSGDMIVGDAGSADASDYTVLGDTVNLASRLEAHTKVADRAILIDGATQAELRNGVALESLGAIDIRGKTHPVDVFAIATQPQD